MISFEDRSAPTDISMIDYVTARIAYLSVYPDSENENDRATFKGHDRNVNRERVEEEKKRRQEKKAAKALLSKAAQAAREAENKEKGEKKNGRGRGGRGKKVEPDAKGASHKQVNEAAAKEQEPAAMGQDQALDEAMEVGDEQAAGEILPRQLAQAS